MSSGSVITKPVTWNSSSSWYNPVQFFTQTGLSAETSALNYGEYLKAVGANPCSGVYVKDGYFVTDTGYKTGVNTQNYNFFGNYVSICTQVCLICYK